LIGPRFAAGRNCASPVAKPRSGCPSAKHSPYLSDSATSVIDDIDAGAREETVIKLSQKAYREGKV
jgi:hypothetical protein